MDDYVNLKIQQDLYDKEGKKITFYNQNSENGDHFYDENFDDLGLGESQQ